MQDASPSSHAGRKHATELTSARTVLGLVWSSVAPNGLQLEQQLSPQVADAEKSQPREEYSSICEKRMRTHTHMHTRTIKECKTHTQPNNQKKRTQTKWAHTSSFLDGRGKVEIREQRRTAEEEKEETKEDTRMNPPRQAQSIRQEEGEVD